MQYRRLLTTVLIATCLTGATPPALASSSHQRDTGLCDLLGRILGLECDAEHAPEPGTEPSAGAAAGPTGPSTDEPAVRATDPVVRYDPGRLTVTFKRHVSRQAVDAVFARARVELERAIPPIRAYLVRVAPSRRAAALRSLLHSSLVATAEREPIVEAFALTPDDDDWPQQWGLRLAGFPDAWSLTRGSSGVVVAVLDTGVDRAQPELRGALVPGYDFVNGDADPSDDHGHGTPVAGIVGARGNNRTGVAGVCWNCSVMPVKVLDANGSGLDTVIAAGIVWAADHGARVINLSLGGPGDTENLQNAIAYAVRKNVVVVAAAGNSGTTAVNYPAGNPAAVSVAGTNSADRRYSWSNYGSWVRVAAPGCNVAPGRGGKDEIFCGTSSATPLVAGLAALAVSANPSATPAEVAEALQRAAVPVGDVVQHGRIDAGRTLSLLATRSTVVLRGTVGRRTPSRAFSLPVAAGRVTATLAFREARGLALSLFFGDVPRPLARLQGRSPVRLSAEVPGGTMRMVVRGTRRAPFTLTVSYPRNRD